MRGILSETDRCVRHKMRFLPQYYTPVELCWLRVLVSDIHF